MAKAMFAAGCFWGVEEAFSQMKGVTRTTVGYSGGNFENPTYKDVCGGKTGHAEVVEVEFDSTIITFEDLVRAFWRLHDPTTLNRQGPDQGSQYRSAIFYFDEHQKNVAEESKASAQKSFEDPIVTEITAATHFWRAEEYHQKYLQKNGRGYSCH